MKTPPYHDSERSRDRFSKASPDLHGSITPSDIRRDDHLAARVRLTNDASDFESFSIWRLSPFGIEVLSHASHVPAKLSQVDLELTVEGRTSTFRGIVVDIVLAKDNSKEVLIGIRFIPKQPSPENPTEGDRRNFERWLCSEEFYPTCVTPTPGRINDYIYFRIHDISEKGMLMKCSLRNKHLLPEMKLELFAQFPGCDNARVNVIIRRISIREEAGKDILSVGVEFENLNAQAQQSIGQYLLQFGTITSIKDVSSAGFVPSSIAKGAEFHFLKLDADYKDVLKLRLLAHKEEGNIVGKTLPADMGDINDSRSRIIVGKIKGEVVATARLRFNEQDTPLEHEAYVTWPENFPRRDQIVEISRACTHPDYRKSDLFAALWQYMSTYALQRQRPYVVIGSWPSMINFYKKCGFELTGLSHEEPLWNKEQLILMCDLHKVILGQNTHPVYWNYLYREVAERAIDNQVLMPNDLERIRMSTYRVVAWLAKLRFRKPRRRSRSPSE